jgi:solute carrier family 24 (sodium/potassium/calcium exchanger), member 6
MYYCSF